MRERKQPGAYAMRVAARMTGIDPETLRIWERRYGFPRPSRSPGGSRLYSASEIEKLQAMGRAVRSGFRPSDIANKDTAEIEALIAATAPPASAGLEDRVQTLLDLLLREDLVGVRSELRRAALLLGPRGFVVELAHPLALRVGTLWHEGKLEVHHEHLMTEALSTQLHLLLSSFDDRREPVVLLTTLPGELHGLALELVAVHLAAAGVAPRVLGASTPREQILRAARAHDARAVGISVSLASDRGAAARDVRWLAEELPQRIQLWVGGAAAPELKLAGAGVRLVRSWVDLEASVVQLVGG